MPKTLRRLGSVAAIVAALAFVSFATPSRAEAQPMMDVGQQIDATPKGTIGLGIIGAEIGFAIPALAGLHDAWAFVVFPLIGAAGGAVAGYFAIDNNDNEKAAVAMLATGMALIVPTLVLTLAMTAYDPDDDDDDEDEADESSSDGDEDAEEASEPADEESAQEAALRRRVRAARAGAGLFRIDDGALQLGVPGLSLQATYSRDELWRFGGRNRTGVQVALFTGAF